VPFFTLCPKPKDVDFERLEDDEDSLNMSVSHISSFANSSVRRHGHRVNEGRGRIVLRIFDSPHLNL